MTMQTSRRLQGGWSLAGMIVVAAVAVTSLGVGVKVALDSATRSRQESAATQQAHEMRAMAAAAAAYATETIKDFEPDTPRILSVQTLIDGGKLPPGWSRRWAQAGETPLGQVYEARAVLPASNPNTIKILVGEAGLARPEALSRLSLPLGNAEAQEIHAFKRLVSRKITTQQSTTITGMLISPATTVVLEGRGEVDVSELFGGNVTVTAATILLGFPELGQTLDTCPNGNCPRPPPPSASSCRVVTPVAGATASCPVGYENMGSWPHCDMLNTDKHNVYGTRAGPVTLGGEWTFYKHGEYRHESQVMGPAEVDLGPGVVNIFQETRATHDPPKTIGGCEGMYCKLLGWLPVSYMDELINNLDGSSVRITGNVAKYRLSRHKVWYTVFLNTKTKQSVSLNTDVLLTYACDENRWGQVSGTNNWRMSTGAVPRAYASNHPRDILCCAE